MPFDAAQSDAPHARDNAPWSGPVTDGALYMVAGAQGAASLWFDRHLTDHACTYFDAGKIGHQVALNGRTFDVVRL